MKRQSAEEALIPWRQILSSIEKEPSLVVPDYDVLLTRLYFLAALLSAGPLLSQQTLTRLSVMLTDARQE